MLVVLQVHLSGVFLNHRNVINVNLTEMHVSILHRNSLSSLCVASNFLFREILRQIRLFLMCSYLGNLFGYFITCATLKHMHSIEHQWISFQILLLSKVEFFGHFNFELANIGNFDVLFDLQNLLLPCQITHVRFRERLLLVCLNIVHRHFGQLQTAFLFKKLLEVGMIFDLAHKTIAPNEAWIRSILRRALEIILVGLRTSRIEAFEEIITVFQC